MEKDIDVIKIYEGIIKNIVLVFFSLMMTFLSIVIFNVALEIGGFQKIVMELIGTLGFVIFSIAILFYFKQAIVRKPVIILSTEGFVNHKYSLLKENPFIPWADVLEIEIRDLLSASYLCIDLINEDEYLSSMSNSMRIGARAHMKIGYSVISISANTLKGYDINALYDEFEFYRGIYLNSNKY